jgi:hypothetical protein
MIIKSFTKLNPIWKAFNPDPEEIFTIVRMKILPCIDNGLSWVYIIYLIQ